MLGTISGFAWLPDLRKWCALGTIAGFEWLPDLRKICLLGQFLALHGCLI